MIGLQIIWKCKQMPNCMEIIRNLCVNRTEFVQKLYGNCTNIAQQLFYIEQMIRPSPEIKVNQNRYVICSWQIFVSPNLICIYILHIWSKWPVPQRQMWKGTQMPRTKEWKKGGRLLMESSQQNSRVSRSNQARHVF